VYRAARDRFGVNWELAASMRVVVLRGFLFQIGYCLQENVADDGEAARVNLVQKCLVGCANKSSAHRSR
jgi:hypothetical protein